MRKVDVLFCVELVARELEVACAVKHLAKVHHGLDVEVIPIQTAHAYVARNLRPRMLALPYAYRVTDSYATQLVELFPGIKVLNVAWEQLPYRAFEAEKTPSDTFTCEYVMHHAWSELHRGRLLKAGVPDAHVFVNGAPAYMLYDEPYRERRPSREDLAERYGLDPRRRWCLFSENYGWAFNSEEKVDRLAEHGMSRDTMDELAGFCGRSLPVVLSWLSELATLHDFEVVVRPRPSTFISDYREVVERSVPEIPKHLHIIKDGPVQDWILASDVVTSSYSTTLIEAAYAGKNAFMSLPEPLPDSLASEWYRCLPQISDRQRFIETCHASPDHSKPLQDWARRTLLANGDPIRGLADLLARIVDPAHPHPPLPPRDAFTRKQRGWRALPQPGDGPRDWIERTHQYLRFELRRLRRARGSARKDEFRLEDRKVPEKLKKWVDRRDLFDASDVRRIAGEWRRILSHAPSTRPPQGRDVSA